MTKRIASSTGYLGVALLSLSLPAAPTWGQAPPAPERVKALFVTVPQPLDSDLVNWVKAQTTRFVNHEGPGVKVVYDFNPNGAPCASNDYGVNYNLAKFLLNDPSLQNVTTIAFVRSEVTGHRVLPVLACKEIVMADKGKLGPVLHDHGLLEPSEKDFYEYLARRRGLFPAVVLKMLDKDVVLMRGKLKDDPWYIDARRRDEEVKKGFVPERLVPGIAQGQTEGYSPKRADELGLVKRQLESPLEIQEAYNLRWANPWEDAERPPVAGRLRLSGSVSPGMKEEIQQSIRQAVARKTNLFILQLDCRGGDVHAARQIADFFSTLRDDEGKETVTTVAYIAKDAGYTATIIALGCREIILHKDAHLGQLEDLFKRHDDNFRKNTAWSLNLPELAKQQGYAPLLAQGFVDPDVVIHLAEHKQNIGQFKAMEPEAIDQSKEWANRGPIKEKGQLLTLDSSQAQQLGLARAVYDGSADNLVTWLKERYGVKEIPEIPLGWLHHVATFLRSPEVSYLLVIIGIAGLILELKIPGFGLPGVLAAICFVLYFWAHSQQMSGSLTMLAVLLFLLGLILIGVEVFLVPGLGITGISGIILLIVSLGLVTLVKKPETTHEWIEFGTTLTTLGFCLVAAVTGAIVAAWYLPHIPWANRLVLAPPVGAVGGLEEEPRGPDYTALLGTIGEAATTLRPAGKARFGDDYLDVVAEGSYVTAGTRVQVVEVEGNRIVVKEV
jgi:membrane-bound ClpP family serine protease